MSRGSSHTSVDARRNTATSVRSALNRIGFVEARTTQPDEQAGMYDGGSSRANGENGRPSDRRPVGSSFGRVGRRRSLLFDLARRCRAFEVHEEVDRLHALFAEALEEE